jgi:hypothetical protein
MKKYLLILSIIFSFSGFSQVNFPDSNAIWNVVELNVSDDPIGEIKYGIAGDTLLTDTLYHKLYVLNDTAININKSIYLGGIRNNLGKVWFKPTYWSGMDILLYDFSLNIGDTIWHNGRLHFLYNGEHVFNNSDLYSVIQDIIVEDNSNRIILNRIDHWSDEWIPGIGSIRGLFNPIMAIPFSDHPDKLGCLKQDNVVKYLDNPICNNCFCTGFTGIDEKKNNPDWITIFPNPARNSLTLKIDKPYSQISVELIDEKGSIIYSKETLKNPIDITNISGIIFIKLTIDNEMILRKVIIE